MSTVTKASEANQKALETASRLQLDVLKETNDRIMQVLTRLETTLDTLEADKEILESFLAGQDSLVERQNTQIEAMIKLHAEMTEAARVILENQG